MTMTDIILILNKLFIWFIKDYKSSIMYKLNIVKNRFKETLILVLNKLLI